MASSERIIFQPYVTGKRGGVIPGPPIACRNREEAARRAEKAMAAGAAIGGHVVQMTADEEVGDYGEPEYLLTVGMVPEQG
jgi:hypothetical protein